MPDVYNLYQGVMHAYMQGVQLKQQREATQQQHELQMAQMDQTNALQQQHMQQQQMQFDSTLQLHKDAATQAKTKYESDLQNQKQEHVMKVEAHRGNVMKGIDAGHYDTLTPDANGMRTLDDPFLGKMNIPSPEERSKQKATAKAVELKTLAPTQLDIKKTEQAGLLPGEVAKTTAITQATDAAHQPDQIADEARANADKKTAAEHAATLALGNAKELAGLRHTNAMTEDQARQALSFRYKELGAKKGLDRDDETAIGDAEHGLLLKEDLSRVFPKAADRTGTYQAIRKAGVQIMDKKQVDGLNEVKGSIEYLRTLKDMDKILTEKGLAASVGGEYLGLQRSAEAYLTTLKKTSGADTVLSKDDRKALENAITTRTGSLTGSNKVPLAKLETIIKGRLDFGFRGMNAKQRMAVADTLGIDKSMLME